MFKNNCDKNDHICYRAAETGNLDIMKLARANGCPWDYYTSATPKAAAGNGHLHILKWLKEKGCPMNNCTSYAAAQYGHVHVLQWIKENCDWEFSEFEMQVLEKNKK